MRVALEKGVDVVSVNDPFIDLAYMVITPLLLPLFSGISPHTLRPALEKLSLLLKQSLLQE